MAKVRLAVFLFWAVLAASALSTDSAGAITTNGAGVLLLHAEGPYRLGDYKMCDSLTLESWEQAETRLPGDGTPYLIGCYAAFPPDSTARLKALTFGVRYSENVRVISLGPCNGGVLIIPGMHFPASGGGVGVPFTDRAPKEGQLLTMYWFAVQSDGPGFFEVMPHPVYKLAGTFASDDIPAHNEPITGFGRIGFDMEGRLPAPGERHFRGACCTPDGCWIVSELECKYYNSVFLGPGVGCGTEPCGENALRGGCCLPDGCEEHTWVDCILLGGRFLGEGVACDSLPCPDQRTEAREGR